MGSPPPHTWYTWYTVDWPLEPSSPHLVHSGLAPGALLPTPGTQWIGPWSPPPHTWYTWYTVDWPLEPSSPHLVHMDTRDFCLEGGSFSACAHKKKPVATRCLNQLLYMPLAVYYLNISSNLGGELFLGGENPSVTPPLSMKPCT